MGRGGNTSIVQVIFLESFGLKGSFCSTPSLLLQLDKKIPSLCQFVIGKGKIRMSLKPLQSSEST